MTFSLNTDQWDNVTFTNLRDALQMLSFLGYVITTMTTEHLWNTYFFSFNMAGLHNVLKILKNIVLYKIEVPDHKDAKTDIWKRLLFLSKHLVFTYLNHHPYQEHRILAEFIEFVQHLKFWAMDNIDSEVLAELYSLDVKLLEVAVKRIDSSSRTITA